MKKALVLVCALLALCLCVPAMASTAELLYTVPGTDASLLDSLDLLWVKGDNGSYLAALDGSALTEALYDPYPMQRYGYLYVSIGDTQKGILAPDGTLVVPCQYDVVAVENEFGREPAWATGVKLLPATEDAYDYWTVGGDAETCYWNIETMDIYNLASRSCVASLGFDQVAGIEPLGDYINVIDRAGSVTCYDASFTVVGENLSSQYDESALPEELRSDYGMPEVFSDEDTYLCGIRTADGTVAVKAEYDFASVYNTEDGVLYTFSVELNDEWKNGVMDAQGSIIVPAEYDEISLDATGLIIAQKDGTYWVLAKDGTVICDTGISAEDGWAYHGKNCVYVSFDEAPTVVVNADSTVYTAEGYESFYGTEGSDLFLAYDADYCEYLADPYGSVILQGGSYTVGQSGQYAADTSYADDCIYIYEIQ